MYNFAIVSFIKIYNKSNKEVVIDIDGYIGMDWWKENGKQNTKERLKNELKEISKIKADTIVVNINSYGGDVNHGLSIHDLLAENPAKVITKINGMTASAATIIALAGDERKMSDNALALIHLSRHFALGNVNDFKTAIETMDAVNERLINMYSKTGSKEKEYYKNLMNENNGNGKWIDADEMLDIGLITDKFEPTKLAANFDFEKHRLPIPPSNLLPKNDADKDDRLLTKILNGIKEFLQPTDEGVIPNKKTTNKMAKETKNDTQNQDELTIEQKFEKLTADFEELQAKLNDDTEGDDVPTEKTIEQKYEALVQKYNDLEAKVEAFGESAAAEGTEGAEHDAVVTTDTEDYMNLDIHKKVEAYTIPKTETEEEKS